MAADIEKALMISVREEDRGCFAFPVGEGSEE